MNPPTILLIEDDVEMLRLLTAAFTKAGYDVHTATDGRMGMKAFARVVPDAVVTDIVMPTQEGIETIIAMRAARPEVKIVAISGGGRLAAGTVLNIADHLGADRTIAKPFQLANLVAVVAQMIEPQAATAAS